MIEEVFSTALNRVDVLIDVKRMIVGGGHYSFLEVKRAPEGALAAYLPLRGGGEEGLRSGICVRTEPARLFAACVAEGWRSTLDASVPREGDDFSFAAMIWALSTLKFMEATASAAGREFPPSSGNSHGFRFVNPSHK
ncbi:hypothetical protein D9M72_564310 [compost metagenome]